MLNEVQHARSEDEAAEMEEVMHAGWAVRIGAALAMLAGAVVMALYIGFMMVMIGLSGCGTARHTPKRNEKPTHRGLSDATELAEPRAL